VEEAHPPETIIIAFLTEAAYYLTSLGIGPWHGLSD